MAKLRRLVKSLEAAGWHVVERRSGLLRLTHPNRTSILTVPDHKQNLPDMVADTVQHMAGVTTPTAPTTGGRR